MTSDRRTLAKRLHITGAVRDERCYARDTAHDGRHVSIAKTNATPELAEELERLARRRAQSDRNT